MNWLLIVIGIAIVVAGAELLVRGAVGLASLAKISPLVIGLTVVAFGTSAPEMSVSVVSSIRGEPEIALGNVVGSNIFNVLFVLGVSALIVPLVVSRQLLKLDLPLLAAVSIATYWMALDGTVSRWEGAALFTGLLLYTIALIRLGRRDASNDAKSLSNVSVALEDGDGRSAPFAAMVINALQFAVGLGLLIYGASVLVTASSEIARQFGISDLIIGVTIVAVGTSLPEVATSIAAAIKGERDLAVGNVVGSNLFNLMGVLGASAFVSTEGMPIAVDAIRWDIPVMLAIALLAYPIAWSGGTIARWEGALMFGGYVAYTVHLVFQVSKSDRLETFESMMMWGVIPVVILLFLVLTRRDVQRSLADAPK